MKLSEYHNVVRKQARDHLDNVMTLPLLEEKDNDKKYRVILHYFGTYKDIAWNVISPLKSFFDKKAEDIATAIASNAQDVRKAIDVFSLLLEAKAKSNKKSVNKQFGTETATDLYEYLRNRTSSFIENLATIVADREEIPLIEEEVDIKEKNAISSIILDIVANAEGISKDFKNLTPCGTILSEYAKMIDPNRWIKRVTDDVVRYILKNSKEAKTEDLEESFYFRVQDIVGEMILTTLVWLFITLTDELKYEKNQIIVEILLVSMISPDHLKSWDSLFRRMSIGAITYRMGKVLKYIN